MLKGWQSLIYNSNSDFIYIHNSYLVFGFFAGHDENILSYLHIPLTACHVHLCCDHIEMIKVGGHTWRRTCSCLCKVLQSLRLPRKIKYVMLLNFPWRLLYLQRGLGRMISRDEHRSTYFINNIKTSSFLFNVKENIFFR